MTRPLWPLVGRDGEFSEVISALAAQEAGVVVLAGEAGVGKTRLAREAVTRLRRSGRAVTWVQANESLRRIPWGPFSGLVAGSRDAASALASLVATLSTGGIDGRMPLVACDDAHCLDDSSAAVIAEVVASGGAQVLVTVRSDEELPDAISRLSRDDRAVAIEVRALPVEVVAILLPRVLGGEVDSRTIRDVHALSEGNPLHLRELVTGEYASGRLRPVNGRWRWSEDRSVPPGLANIISARLSRLDAITALLVDVLASCAPLPSRVLGRFVDVTTLERAEAAALIRAHDERTSQLAFELVHPLYAEVARLRMGRHRRRRLNGELVEALAADRAATGAAAAPADLIRSALLRAESDLPADARVMTEAAEAALHGADLALAERFSRLAAPTGRPLVVLGHALSWQARGADARAVFDQLVAPDPETATVVLIGRAGNAFWSLRQIDEGIRLVRSGLDRDDAAPGADALRATLAVFTVFSGRTAEGVRLAESVCAGDLPAIARIFCAWALVAGYWLQGRDLDLDDAASRAYAASTRDESVLRFSIAELHLRGLRAAGRNSDAAGIGEAVCADAAEVGGPTAGMVLAVRGLAEMIGSRPAAAVRLLSEAVISLEPVAANGWLFVGHLDLAQALALTGDASRARAVLRRALDDRHPAFAMMREEVLLTEAWVAASEGWASEATRCVLRCTELSRELGHLGSEVLGWATLSQFGDGRGAPRLRELALALRSPRSEAAAVHATALLERDARQLEEAAALYERMGDTVAALDAVSQASSEYRRRGLGREAAVAARRAEELSARAGGAVTPAFRGIRSPATLTGREREVAALASAGRTNREVAALLGISVRTVEGHVYRALVKLGGSDRSSLRGSAQNDRVSGEPEGAAPRTREGQAVTTPK